MNHVSQELRRPLNKLLIALNAATDITQIKENKRRNKNVFKHF